MDLTTSTSWWKWCYITLSWTTTEATYDLTPDIRHPHRGYLMGYFQTYQKAWQNVQSKFNVYVFIVSETITDETCRPTLVCDHDV